MKKYYVGHIFTLLGGSRVPTFKLWLGRGVSLFDLRGIPDPTFKLWGESWVPGSRGPTSRDPGPTCTPCYILLDIYLSISCRQNSFLFWIYRILISSVLSNSLSGYFTAYFSSYRKLFFLLSSFLFHSPCPKFVF